MSLYPGSESMVSHSGILLPKDAVNFWFDFSIAPVVETWGRSYLPVYASSGASATVPPACSSIGVIHPRTSVSGTSLSAPDGLNFQSDIFSNLNGSLVLVYDHVAVNGTIANGQSAAMLFGDAIQEIKSNTDPRLMTGNWMYGLSPLGDYQVPVRSCLVVSPLRFTCSFLSTTGVVEASCMPDNLSIGPFSISAGMNNVTTGTKIRPMEYINTTRPLTEAEVKVVLTRLSAKWAVPSLVPV